MRLTVGPLPAAVYWRRRAVVLAGVLLIGLIIFYACTGPSAEPGANPSSSSSPTPTSTRSPSPSATPSPAATSARPSASPSPSAFVLPGRTGACSDNELALTASASSNTVSRGSIIQFRITIKNVSSRTCVRDIGGAAQELQLRMKDSELVVWSSDDICPPQPDSDHFEQEFAPGFQRVFERNWNGARTRDANGDPDCSVALMVDPGVYDLVARLGNILSEPYRIQVQSSGA